MTEFSRKDAMPVQVIRRIVLVERGGPHEQYSELTIPARSFDVGRAVKAVQPAVRHRLSLTMGGLSRRMARFFADG
jgi:hypothetical protein